MNITFESEINSLRSQAPGDQGMTPKDKPKKAAVSNRSFKVPVGRVNEVLKSATKPALMKIKGSWPEMLESLKRSQAALLNDAEPVAASEQAFVLKFKYEIHCQMAMNNQEFISGLKSTLLQITGSSFDIVGVPEDAWKKIREEYVANQKTDNDEEKSSQEPAEEDPLIVKARELFGDELVEIKE